MSILVFLSYATDDIIEFQVSLIAERLTQKENINDVLYWEEDADRSIIKFMNDNIPKCDIFLLFCSQNALKSGPIAVEWETAIVFKKDIIPIFKSIEDVPPLLRRLRGIQFRGKDLEGTVNEIYTKILKLVKKPVKALPIPSPPSPQVEKIVKNIYDEELQEIQSIILSLKGKTVPGHLLNVEGEISVPNFTRIYRSYRVPTTQNVLDLYCESEEINWQIEIKHRADRLLFNQLFRYRAGLTKHLKNTKLWLIIFGSLSQDFRKWAREVGWLLTDRNTLATLKKLSES